jgi:hypothetical protein
VREFEPEHAVPFASMVGFLHPETRRYNELSVTPPEIAAAARGADLGDTAVAVMAPGDSWSSSEGFAIAKPDPFADREAALATLARQVEPQLRATAEAEGTRTADYDAFHRHLSGLLAALPPGSSGVLTRPVVFHVPSSPEPYWVVDVRRRTVYRATAPPANRGTLLRIPEAVLADAIDKRILSFVHISLRIAIEISPGGLRTDFAFWALLTFYEIGYLPLRKCLTPRVLGVAWRRRVEARQLLAALVGPSTLAEKVLSALMTTERNP